jgi:hypothetical protein
MTPGARSGGSAHAAAGERTAGGGVPLAERQVAGHDQAASLVQRRDHLEEQVGLVAVHGQVTDLVDDQ